MLIDKDELQIELDSAKADLLALETEYQNLSDERHRLFSRIVEIDSRMGVLKIPMSYGGLIVNAKHRLAEAQNKYNDSDKQKVTTSDGIVVVIRITAKRVFFKKWGSDRELSANRGTKRGKLSEDDLRLIIEQAHIR